jgi:(4S)-4-hydroxy-5-phosphonooxypentane-2,3-dione isomerase
MRMSKTMTMSVAAAALAVAAWLLLPVSGHRALAEAEPFFINAVDIDVVPGQIDAYLAALKENGATAVKEEPGCREFNITVSQKDPNHVFIFEVYENAAALETHRATAHYKKYAATTKDMVAKRDPHPLTAVALNSKGK